VKIQVSSRPGRTLSKPKTGDSRAYAFFEAADELGLRLKDVERELALRLTHPPSYRTLQDWRSGRRAPKFAPLEEWSELLKAANHETRHFTKKPKQRPAKKVSETMAKIRSSGSAMEKEFEKRLVDAGINAERQWKGALGRPDFAIPRLRVAIFCDSDFWHGRGFSDNWATRFGKKAAYWMEKIRGNVARDAYVTSRLRRAGWAVIRIWESDLKANPNRAIKEISLSLKRRAKKFQAGGEP
jgi:DNA mismatch endonuclease (patch repair protein)